MELKISEKKRKKYMRLRGWGIFHIFFSLLSFTVIQTILIKLIGDTHHTLFLSVPFAAVILFRAAYDIKIAQKSKTQRVYIKDDLLYIIHIWIKSESSYSSDVCTEKEVYTITVVSYKSDIKMTKGKIKFSGIGTIRTKENFKKITSDTYLNLILSDNFDSNIKKAKGTYANNTFLLRILEENEEKKIMDLFS